MRILITPEYWLPHVHYLIQAFRLAPQPEVEVFWTNEMWWRTEEHGPREDAGCVRFMPVEEAMTALGDGWFDAAVFSEGTLALFLARLGKTSTKIVFLDSADHRYLVKPFLDASDVYLKCQASEDGRMLVGDSITLESMYGGEKKVLPWPYCPSSWVSPSWEPPAGPRRPVVHFRGWAWPSKRVKAVESLREASVPICGGLYERSGIQMNCEFDRGLLAERISFREYMDEMAACAVALNTVGNGEMCFRTCEAWRSGACVVTHPINVAFPGRKPRNMEEWVVVDDPADLPKVATMLLGEPELCARIGKAGRAYWDSFQSPEAWARRFVSAIS